MYPGVTAWKMALQWPICVPFIVENQWCHLVPPIWNSSFPCEFSGQNGPKMAENGHFDNFLGHRQPPTARFWTPSWETLPLETPSNVQKQRCVG